MTSQITWDFMVLTSVSRILIGALFLWHSRSSTIKLSLSHVTIILVHVQTEIWMELKKKKEEIQGVCTLNYNK